MELTIEQRVWAVVSQELGLRLEEIHPAARLIEDCGADSMDVHSLVLALEDEFAVEIPDTDLGELLTIRNVVHYLAVRAGTATT